MCLDNYQKIAIGLFSLKSGGNSEIYKKWEVGVKIWRVTPKSGDLASMNGTTCNDETPEETGLKQ